LPYFIFHLSSFIFPLCVLCGSILPFPIAQAAPPWSEPTCAYRRPVTVTWDSDNSTGREMAMVDCLTSGHANPDAGDLRVTTQGGKEIPSRVLWTGPGDLVRIIFPLAPATRDYEIYFGNPQAPPPFTLDTLPITCGLLLEMRHCDKIGVNAQNLSDLWNQAGPVLGRTMTDLPFLAGTPLGNANHVILRYTGSLSIPADAQYDFATAAESEGALFVDGQPIVYAPGVVNVATFHATLHLSRGTHDFLYLQTNNDGHEYLSVCWRFPGDTDFKPISREYFGLLSYGRTGDLESRDTKPLADFSADYQGICEFGDSYDTHRYTFTAAGNDPDAQWDFGDGQTATGATVDHVFLADGVYPIQIRQHGDTQTCHLAVHADWRNMDDASVDLPWTQAKIVAAYDLQKIPTPLLPTAVLMQVEAENWPTADWLAVRLAKEKSHGPGGIDAAMNALTIVAKKHSDWRSGAKLWSLVPDDSDLQPQAAIAQAELFTWSAADFPRAVARLANLAAQRPQDAALQRAFAHALILDGQSDQGEKILNSLPLSDDPRRLPAISGALARSVEYYLDQRDLDTAQSTWDQWDARDPTSFLEGYSVLLRVRLLNLRREPQLAAKIAVAFAQAEPNSAYSPQLLDEASQMLANVDPTRSRQIRDMLKETYPEDPLSQK
jgi:hypothetical protein